MALNWVSCMSYLCQMGLGNSFDAGGSEWSGHGPVSANSSPDLAVFCCLVLREDVGTASLMSESCSAAFPSSQNLEALESLKR